LLLSFPLLTLLLPSATTRTGILIHVYYPAQSASSLVVYERGHLTAPEIFRFGVWMTLVAYVVVLTVALPYWAMVGEPLRLSSGP
jgi:di/tricarboxylate transporter